MFGELLVLRSSFQQHSGYIGTSTPRKHVVIVLLTKQAVSDTFRTFTTCFVHGGFALDTHRTQMKRNTKFQRYWFLSPVLVNFDFRFIALPTFGKCVFFFRGCNLVFRFFRTLIRLGIRRLEQKNKNNSFLFRCAMAMLSCWTDRQHFLVVRPIDYSYH